jgi:hypothetical protein
LSIWRSAPDYRVSLSPPMAWMGLIVRSSVTQELDDTLAADNGPGRQAPAGCAVDGADAARQQEFAGIGLGQCAAKRRCAHDEGCGECFHA